MAVAGVTSASSAATVSASPPRRDVGSVPTLTTPAWLRLSAVALVVGLAALAVVSVRVAIGRGDATRTVVADATPLLADAEDLYVALAHADAAASTTFLQAGAESPERRARYLRDLERAGTELLEVGARTRGSAESRGAVGRIAQDLPLYAGGVESARANNRLDFPLGAAHLRRASDTMRGSILPAATGIYEQAARRLYDAYDRGTATRHRLALLTVAGVVLVLLVAVQAFVALRTRRVLNLGLVGATVIVAALGVWGLVALDAQQQALARSQREGSDQLLVLSTTRILALRALSDQNLHLIERGTEKAYLEDFASVKGTVADRLDEAMQLAERTGSTAVIERIQGLWDDYLAVHDRAGRLHDAGTYLVAVRVAVNDEAAAAERLDGALAAEIDAARSRLDAGASAARDHVRWLTAAVLVAALVAAILAVAGLWSRIKEYR